jgi:hypothetical protein
MDTDFSNGLADDEVERLALLSEEMGEAQQIIGKILRYGFEGYHPKDQNTTNRMLLEKELGHIETARELMINAGDIDDESIADEANLKRDSVHKYLHHQ